MKPDRVVARLAQDPTDKNLLNRTGDALGDEIPRWRAHVLNDFRSRMARQLSDVTDPYALGYIMALRDVAAGATVRIKEYSLARLCAVALTKLHWWLAR
jgi:hypothetical protein